MGAWFPDGERILTCGSEKGRGPRCFEQRVGGPPKAVTPEGLVGAALSADGRLLLGQDSNRTWQIVDLASGTLRAAAGLQPTDGAAGWSSDGTAAFVARVPQVPARLERVDLQTGVRTFKRELAPPDPAGVSVPSRPASSTTRADTRISTFATSRRGTSSRTPVSPAERGRPTTSSSKRRASRGRSSSRPRTSRCFGTASWCTTGGW